MEQFIYLELEFLRLEFHKTINKRTRYKEEQRKTIWLEKNRHWVDDLAGEEQMLGGEEEEEEEKERTVGNKMVELKS